MTYPTLTEQPVPRPRRKRRGLRWLIVLLVLAVLFVIADRVAASVAEDELAGKIQQNQHLSQKPSVSIGGFPFLTQVAAHDFGHATVDIHGLVSNGIPIANLNADLTGVHVASNFQSGTADQVTATALLDDATLSSELSKRTDVGQITLSTAADGQLKASLSVAGFSLSTEVTAVPLPGNVIEFKSGTINTPLSGFGLSLPKGLDVKIQIGTLPFDMQIQSVQAVSGDQVKIVTTGTNVPLNQNAAVQ